MNRPLVWVGLAFLAGTLAGAYAVMPGLILPTVTALFCLLSCSFLRRRPGVATWAGFAVFFAGGALLWNIRHLQPPGDPLSQFAASKPEVRCTLEGRVRNADVFLPKTVFFQFLVDVDSVTVAGERTPIPGGVAVRWSNPDHPVFPGERVRVAGTLSTALSRVNPGCQSPEDYLRRRGIHSAIRVRGPGAVKVVAPASFWEPTYWAARLRAWEAKELAAALPEHVLPFIRTVWLGESNQTQDDEYRMFVASGTAHILAVSGVNVVIFYASFMVLLRLLVPNRRRLRIVVAMAGVLVFALASGARITCIRAAVMFLVYLAAELFEREPDAPHALSFSAFLFLLHDPDLVFDGGFQLSFLSVASILLFSGPIAAALTWLPRVGFEKAVGSSVGVTHFRSLIDRVFRLVIPVREGLAVALAVQILPLPLAIYHFHVLPLLAPLANLVVVPALTVCLWFSFITVGAGIVSSHLALLFGHSLQPVVWLIHETAALVAGARGGHFDLVSPTPQAMVCYWGALGLGLLYLHVQSQKRLALAAAAVLAALTMVLWSPFHPTPGVFFLDVGHGDAIFCRSPEGRTLLVDGGDANERYDAGEDLVAPFLWSNYVSRLDCVAVSHADRDHMGGLFHILRNFPVGEVLLPPLDSGKPLEQEFLALCGARGVAVRRLARGDMRSLGSVSLDVLHPPRDWPETANLNDQSLVLRLAYGPATVLLTGDIQTQAEALLATEACTADVLKVPHHGSASSSSLPFIRAVRPMYGVVSTGGETGREPVNRGVLARYQAEGIPLWRTDRMGGIELQVEGGSLNFSSARQQRGYPIAQ